MQIIGTTWIYYSKPFAVNTNDEILSRWKKRLFFGLGTIMVGLAYFGLVMPGIPTIPFVLLAAYFYLRSSDKMYAWLLRHRVFGKLLTSFQSRQANPYRVMLVVLLPSWGSIIVAEIWFVQNLWWRLVLLLIGIVGSILFIIFLKKHFKHPKGVVEDSV